MSWAEDLEQGVAGLLAAAGVGTYDPDAVLADGAAGVIVVGPLPDEVAAGIGVQSYRVGVDDPANPTSSVNVQLWARAASRSAVNDLDAAGYDAVQGAADVWFGSVHVTQAYSKSSIPMGRDDRGRWERSSNYTFELDLPATAHRSY